jgi:cell division protein FtsQ
VRAAAAQTLRTLPRVALRARAPLAALRSGVGSLSPKGQMRLLAALGAALLSTFLYYGWFRDSQFVEVRDVTIIGVTSTDAPRIRARVEREARSMTTLHVDEDALRRALGAGLSIASLRVETDFPHGLRIVVVENPPVAVLSAPGLRVPVAADGTLLRKVRASAVPSIVVGALPHSGRLGRGRALRLVGLAATAPAPLRARVMRIRELPGKGLVAYLRRGPQVIFGDAAGLAVKWAAAAAILADESSQGASYVDVRWPDRPVAGGVEVPQPESAQPAPPAAAQPLPGTGATGATGPAGVVPQPQTPLPAQIQQPSTTP